MHSRYQGNVDDEVGTRTSPHGPFAPRWQSQGVATRIVGLIAGPTWTGTLEVALLSTPYRSGGTVRASQSVSTEMTSDATFLSVSRLYSSIPPVIARSKR